ncbi:helix-turn-helix domain-containing protein [Marinimicrobium agarilyticum]|uniref:helix-turn-helix domain-containing protein n=1 Tax=Marinimicrobium agarilyticum TaxID=306546 RepID=UPI0004141CBD|nr:helix-turn-helix transcriptional regulator [Marinimicrobium agarilyticum]
MPKPLVHELDRHLGARLRKRRQQQGVSAAVLAEAVGLTQQQVSRYENGENKLAAVQLYRMASCLNTPLAWFFQGAEQIEEAPAIRDRRGVYRVESAPAEAALEEELSILQAVWPALAAERRAALLQLLDTLSDKT